MRAQRWLSRGLWLLVTVAVGNAIVAGPLAMQPGLRAPRQPAQRAAPVETAMRAAPAAAQGAHAVERGGMAGHDGMPMPMPGPDHSGPCCPLCLTCCPGCAMTSPPTPASAAGADAATVRLVSDDRAPAPAPRSGNHHLQPPPLGPPSPLVS